MPHDDSGVIIKYAMFHSMYIKCYSKHSSAKRTEKFLQHFFIGLCNRPTDYCFDLNVLSVRTLNEKLLVHIQLVCV